MLSNTLASFTPPPKKPLARKLADAGRQVKGLKANPFADAFKAPVQPKEPDTSPIPGESPFSPANQKRESQRRLVETRRFLGQPLQTPGELDASKTKQRAREKNPRDHMSAIQEILRKSPASMQNNRYWKEHVRQFVIAEMGGQTLDENRRPGDNRLLNASGRQYNTSSEIADAFFKSNPDERGALIDRYLKDVRPRAQRRKVMSEEMTREEARGRVKGNPYAQALLSDAQMESLSRLGISDAQTTMAAFDALAEQAANIVRKPLGGEAARKYAEKNPQGLFTPLALGYSFGVEQVAGLAASPAQVAKGIAVQGSPDATSKEKVDAGAEGALAGLNILGAAGAASLGTAASRAAGGGARGFLRGAIEAGKEFLSPIPGLGGKVVESLPKVKASGEVRPVRKSGSGMPEYARAKGEKIPVQWRVMELDEVKQSHDPQTFKPMSDYDPLIQPRDRERGKPRLQVMEMAQNLDPERWIEPQLAIEYGAPIIRPDGIVEHGNGRMMALKRAKALHPERYQDFQASIRKLYPEAGSMKDPVLVRVRMGEPKDMSKYLQVGATATGEGFSTVEKARNDARALNDSFWENWKDSGDTFEDAVRSKDNHIKVLRFIEAMAEGERGEMLTKNGRLSSSGVLRIKNASLMALLGEDGIHIAESALENGDMGRRIGSGLFKAMPELLKGKTPELSDALVWALEDWGRFLESGFKKPQEYRAQARMSSVNNAGLMIFDKLAEVAVGRNGSINQVADVFREIAADGAKIKEMGIQGGMFEDELPPIPNIFDLPTRTPAGVDASRVSKSQMTAKDIDYWTKAAKRWGEDASLGLRQYNVDEDAIKLITAKAGVPYKPKAVKDVDSGLFEGQGSQGALDISKEPKTAKASRATIELDVKEFESRYKQLTDLAKGIGVGIYDAGKPAAPKGAAGAFFHSKKFHNQGEIRMKDLSPGDMAEVLAHEVAHAIDFQVNEGKTSSNMKMLKKVFKIDDDFEFGEIETELKDLTYQIEGGDVVNSDPAYYMKPTELFARFMQSAMFMPDLAENVAPKAMAALRKIAMENESLGQMLVIANGKKLGYDTKAFLADKRQEYHRILGRYLGEKFYQNEKLYQIERSRISHEVRDLIKQKFEGVEDPKENLFNAAEAIRGFEGDEPLLGTWDKAVARTTAEYDDLTGRGFKWFGQYDDIYPVMYMERFSYRDAKKAWDALSDKGKDVIRAYAGSGESAQDFFNRDFLKLKFNLPGEIEGYVHHAWLEKPTWKGFTKSFLKERKAGLTRHREGAGGFERDLAFSTEEAIRDVRLTDAFNKFANKQVTMAAKSFDPQTMEVPSDMVHIRGSKKVGYYRPGQMVTIVKGKPITPGRDFLISKELWEGIESANRTVADVGAVLGFTRSALSVWAGSKLAHPGSWIRNFIGGHMQLAPMILEDMFLDMTNFGGSRSRTMGNVKGYAKTYTKAGREAAPEWSFGGDMANFSSRLAAEEGKLMEHMTRPMTAIETFLKQAIVNMEMQKTPGASLDDPKFLTAVNDVIDRFAFDYSNVPRVLDKARATGLSTAITPFPTWRYKYVKQLTGMLGAAFDPNLPVPVRAARFMTGVIVLMASAAAIEGLRNGVTSNFTGLRESGKTREEAEKIVKKKGGGRGIPIAKDGNEDVYLDTKWMPYFGTGEIFQSLLRQDFDRSEDLMRDHVLNFGPGAELALTMMGYTNEYNTYADKPAQAGRVIGSFMPLDRVIKDTKELFDSSPVPGRVRQRKPEGFLQGLGETLPLPQETPLVGRRKDKVKNGRKVTKDRLDVAARFLGASVNRVKK